jgi:hypothetical protein
VFAQHDKQCWGSTDAPQHCPYDMVIRYELIPKRYATPYGNMAKDVFSIARSCAMLGLFTYQTPIKH